ncbi:hypothetical protein CES85_4820 [Ochrobactrum quorumnocens]|uniref:Uncharacterized protein n=1 Tax=Ochrobactrum quorumnocens TaxID=271865 RepID=A0A248UCG4_9HYPH|nr:hypothetical protein CES85_4820 [[Ochrobactrum] quorumnocens]
MLKVQEAATYSRKTQKAARHSRSFPDLPATHCTLRNAIKA